MAKRADNAMNQLKKVAAVAGAGLGMAALANSAKRGLEEMSKISDVAQQMQVSGDYAVRLEGALNQVGIQGASLEMLNKAFSKMAMETGKVGEDGFKETLKDVASLGSEQERLTELTRVFGRQAGAAFAPLVRQGPEALEKGLEDVMAAMPGLSDSALDAADGVIDALSNAGKQAHHAWLGVLGKLLAKFEETFGMGLGEAILVGAEYVKFGVKVATEYFKVFGENVKKVTAFFVEDWRGALRWVWDGFKGWLSSVWELFKSVFVGIKNIAVELGRNLWKWMKGEDANWSSIWDAAVKGAIDAGEKARKVLQASVPSGGGIEWAKVDTTSLRAAREAAIEVQRRGLAAHDLLVQGAAASADTAAAGAKKIADAAKEAKGITAGSYDALKAAVGSLGASRAGGVAAIGAGATAGRAAANQANDIKDLKELMRQLLGVQRDALNIYRGWGVV